MPPTRILIVSNMYPSAANPAFGVFVSERATAFERLGAMVRVAAVRDARKGGFRTAWKYAALFFNSIASALRFRPDVIEGHYLIPTAPLVAVVALVTRRPFVLYVHGSDVALPHSSLLTGMVRWAVGRAAGIQTNSEWTAAIVEERFGRTASVIPPGVDLAVFHPPQDDSTRSGVAFAGGLDRHKGVDVLIAALGVLPRTASWTLTVVGDGPERSRLEGVAADLHVGDRITWMGSRSHDDVADVFRHARVVVVPSRRDALGLVAVEALACGTPVIVTAVGGLSSIPDSACGSVVPADDPPSLARAIDAWLQNDDRGTREAAVARADQFSLDRLARAALDEVAESAGLRR